MTFGEKLQRFRKEKGWTQEQLAEQISISRQALSKWELGTAIPDTENVLQISKLFGVSTDYLLNDEYESDDDILAVQTRSDSLTRKYIGAIYAVIGGVVSTLSAVGILVMAVLSSIYPAYGNYPQSTEDDAVIVVKTGLLAFVKMHNLGWLFILCIVLFFAGIIVAVYPKLRLRWKTK